MLEGLAQKLSPHVMQIFLVQLMIMLAAVAVGCLIVLKRWAKKSNEPDLSEGNVDTAIAFEISQEIGRLENLKSRLLGGAKLQEPAVPAQGASVATAATPAPGQPAGQVDLEKIRAEVQVAFEKQTAESMQKVADLETELKKTKDSAEALAQQLAQTALSSAAAAVTAEAGGADATAGPRIAALEGEKQELIQKLAHIEKVVAEYRIFEEDFALVKKYKLENEKLKKQLAETHKVTEEDIAGLFQSFEEDTGSAETQETNSFFDPESFKSANFAAPAQEAQTEVAQAPTPAPAVTPDPEPAAQPIDNLDLSKLSEKPANDAEILAGAKGFEVERVREEPVIVKNKASAEDLAELAESAANDDQLLQEFEKILGDKPT
jgi:hypothetical protein